MTVFENSDFITKIRRNFVALSGKFLEVTKGGDKEHNFVFSAFVIEIKNDWFLVTAGHVIQGINRRMADPNWKLLRCGLGDYFAVDAKIKEPMPFVYDPSHTVHENHDRGVDIGFMPLRDLYRMSLTANGIEPMPVARWQDAQMPECDEYCILGLPESKHIDLPANAFRGSGTNVELVLLPIIAEPPQTEPAFQLPIFVGQMADGGQLDSVVGMSGGPIIGIRRNDDGSQEYACVAVQAEWDRNSRKVYGTPTDIIVQAMVLFNSHV